MQEGNNYRDDVYSKPVRAGKRTYFFDVKSTRGNDLPSQKAKEQEMPKVGMSIMKSTKSFCTKKTLKNS